MHVVYEAENVIDAHLVRGRLAAEGVDAFVRGEFLAGGIGELPVSGLLAVWVLEDDLPRAQALLAEWQAERRLADDGGDEDLDQACWPAVLPA
jgi:hypothetical protein